MKAAGETEMRAAFAIKDKQERTNAISAAVDLIKSKLTEEQLADANLGSAIKKLESGILRGDINDAASTVATPRPSVRSWPKWACCRAPTARRRSPAGNPRVGGHHARHRR